MTKKDKTPEFPQKVYVTREEDTDGTCFFTTHETPESAAAVGEERLVAEYKIARVVKIVNRTEVRDA